MACEILCFLVFFTDSTSPSISHCFHFVTVFFSVFLALAIFAGPSSSQPLKYYPLKTPVIRPGLS